MIMEAAIATAIQSFPRRFGWARLFKHDGAGLSAHATSVNDAQVRKRESRLRFFRSLLACRARASIELFRLERGFRVIGQSVTEL
jgi:hypothetical protein